MIQLDGQRIELKQPLTEHPGPGLPALLGDVERTEALPNARHQGHRPDLADSLDSDLSGTALIAVALTGLLGLGAGSADDVDAPHDKRGTRFRAGELEHWMRSHRCPRR